MYLIYGVRLVDQCSVLTQNFLAAILKRPTVPPQIVIIEHKSIICPGYNAVLHIHTCIEEVQIAVRLEYQVRPRCLEGSRVQLQWHHVTLLVVFVSPAGLNLYGRQEDGGEEQDATTICKTGPGLHRPPAHCRDHLPRDLQGVPPDGTVYFTGRRQELLWSRA